jgi:hypothetical protein
VRHPCFTRGYFILILASKNTLFLRERTVFRQETKEKASGLFERRIKEAEQEVVVAVFSASSPGKRRENNAMGIEGIISLFAQGKPRGCRRRRLAGNSQA